MNLWKPAPSPTFDEAKINAIVDKLNGEQSIVKESTQPLQNEEESEEDLFVEKPTEIEEQWEVPPIQQEEQLSAPPSNEEVVEKKEPFPELEIVGQIHGTYIVAQMEDGFYLIDQHAAQERIKYEYFQKRLGK